MKAHGLGIRTVPGWMVTKDEKNLCQEFCRKATAWLRKRGLADDSGFMVEQVNWGFDSLSAYRARQKTAGMRAAQAAYEAKGKQMRKVREARAAAEQKAGEPVPERLGISRWPAPAKGSEADPKQEVPGGLLRSDEPDSL